MIPRPPLLSYCEESMPRGDSDTSALTTQLWQGQDPPGPVLALEIVNRGNLDLDRYQHPDLTITAVQAYQMHEFHPLHPDSSRQRQAVAHVHDTLELAATLDVPRIVTVCGFGSEIADRPHERCLDFFGHCLQRAKELGIHIMIEPLSPRRCGAMTNPYAIAALIETLAAPEVLTLLLDTGHLLDSGYDLDAFFDQWPFPIEELQLKGPNSTTPSADCPVQRWLSALPSLPDVLCVEHRQPITLAAFTALTMTLQETLNRVSNG